MNELWNRLLAGGDELVAIVPSLIAAGLILLTGYFLARQVEKWTDHLLRRMDFNKVAEAGGIAEAVGRTGVRLDPVHAMGKLFFWLVMLVVILLSSMALGLESINQMFGLMLSYLPTLVAGIIIVILGLIVGEFVRALVLASAGAVEGVPTLAKVAKAAVITIAVFMALQQIGVAEEIVTAAFILILGAVALAVGLAFGLGNRELAGQITRRWYRGKDEKDEQGKGEDADADPPPSSSTPSSPSG
jgi:small-conductance mechanosensitive channel